MAVLIGMSAEVKGDSHTIDRDRVTIGRNTTNLITIEHPTVSGRHCCITREGHRYQVKDLDSTNGTRVNGKDIENEPLHPKDLLQIGSVEFMFDAEEVDTEPVKRKTPPNADVEISEGPATAPISFGSISPFGPRSKENPALWYILIIVIGLLALAGVAIVLYMLLA